MPKGKKKCPKCHETIGARSITCKYCGATLCKSKSKPKFKAKPYKKPRLYEEVDWRTLESGDIIRVDSNCGPFYRTESQNVPMNEKGIHKVLFLSEEGVHTRPINKTEMSYIFMGGTRRSATGILLMPHHIMKKIDKSKIDKSKVTK
jgi:hypothetical protein